jgi:branched-chain amino acid transport system ATP-binding protein
VLVVDEIHTYYGHSYILQGISVEVTPGAVLGMIGRNGMGKTTLLRSIIGFTPPRKGKIVYNDMDVTGMVPYQIARQGISLVPQGRQIFPSLTVEENLKVGSSGAKEGWTLEKLYGLFPPLQNRKRQFGGALSGGEQQMLAIGRSLMTNPSLLLMDEPTEGLSPIYVQTVGKVIRDLHQRGMSIFLVEQKIGFVLKYTDYIHIISKGKIVFSCPPAQLAKDQETKDRYLGI